MDKKTLAKLSVETFAQMDMYSPLMINNAANKLELRIKPKDKQELEMLISKALCNFADLFVEYYIYTDDDED